MKKTAFTLVELIVVITILAILATVGFISMIGYAQKTRDTVRLSDTNSIEKGLSVSFLKNNQYPRPDESVDITLSGSVINYQGYAGKNVLNTIGVFSGGKDPITSQYFTYTTNSTFTKYQILTFVEDIDNITMLQNTYAQNQDMSPILSGDKLGTLIDSTTHQPIQESGTGADISTLGQNYDIYLDSDTVLSDDKQNIYSILPNSNCFRIKYFHPNSQDGIYEINPDGTPINKYCFMSYIGKNLVFNVTGDDNDAKDLTGNFSYELINFDIQSEDSKVGKGLYGQYDSSDTGTNVSTGPSYIKYSIINQAVGKLKHTTHCQWIQSFNTNSALHGLVGYYYNPQNQTAFRFTDRLRQNTILAGSSYEYVPTKISLNNNISIGNSWQHICRVFDGSDYYLYLNGEEINKITAAEENQNIELTRTAFSLFYASDTYDSTRYRVDETMVFNEALGADEIKNIYDNQK